MFWSFYFSKIIVLILKSMGLIVSFGIGIRVCVGNCVLNMCMIFFVSMLSLDMLWFIMKIVSLMIWFGCVLSVLIMVVRLV